MMRYLIALTEGDSNIRAQALALKSDIALIQGRKEDAARFARESFGADSTELHGRLAMAQASVSMGNLDEGIRILEEAYVQADYAPHVSFMLGQALMARGTETDVSRAIEVFSSAKLENLDRELIDPVIVSAIRAFSTQSASRTSKLCSTGGGRCFTSDGGDNKGILCPDQSQDAEAGRFLDEAITSRQPEDSRLRHRLPRAHSHGGWPPGRCASDSYKNSSTLRRLTSMWDFC